MVSTLINDRWEVILPVHRNARPEWSWWEATRLAAMFHFIKSGDVVFDVGSEEGDFPALFATWGAELVIIEPNPRVIPNTRAIWEANNLPPLAGWYVGFLSDTIDENPPNLNIDATPRQAENGQVWPECAFGPVIGDHGFRHLAQEADATPQITLDELVRRTGKPPQVITMDVEGSELAVLRGSSDALRDYRPLVFVSVHPPALRDLYNATPDDVHNLMKNAGYEDVFLTNDHEEHWLYVPRERMWPR